MKPAVLVTGGARRIGAAIARTFGQAGWHVIVHYGRSGAEAEALAAVLPSAEIVQCDLADWNAASAMIARLAAQQDDWRVLVNCASIFAEDTASHLEPDTFDAVMRVNAGVPARMAQAFLASANARGGRRVIQITDQKLANPNPDFFSYTMSKHALDATVRMLAMAQTRPGDRVYGLALGAILASHDQTEDETERSHRMNLLARKTGPDEVASACLFLSQGWLASGETVFIDSGQHLLSQPRDVLYLAREQA
jgi:NAD(P)-dependent dehydrogenase (short-subunit alcohol dehydrogenase family)